MQLLKKQKNIEILIIGIFQSIYQYRFFQHSNSLLESDGHSQNTAAAAGKLLIFYTGLLYFFILQINGKVLAIYGLTRLSDMARFLSDLIKHIAL